MHAHLYLEHPTALAVDLLDFIRREPGSDWARIEKRLDIADSEAVPGVAYALAQSFVDDGLLSVDGITIDGITFDLYRTTPAGIEHLMALVPSGELPDVEPLERVA
jgi:hypothetical protein